MRGVGLRRLDSRRNLICVVTIHRQYLPAIGFETLGGVIGKPAFHFAIDGNAIVVIEHDQLAQTERARQGADLVGYPFHQAAVTNKNVSGVIDYCVSKAVELSSQRLFGDRHTNAVRQPLTQRPGSRFNTWRVAVLWVSGSLGMQLPEITDFVHGNIVATQVQQRVDQHGAVAIGHDEAVAIKPARMDRTVAQEVIP